MTIASDFTTYGASQAKASVSTDKAIGGTSGHIAAALPDECNHLAIIPAASGVHFNIGAAATANTAAVPSGGMIFNGDSAVLEDIHLYAASATTVYIFMGGPSLRSILGTNIGGDNIDVIQVGSATADDGAGAVSVGAASTAVLAANADRLAATLVNDSDEVIYLALGEAAVLNQGIRLNANGGSFTINATNRWCGSVNAICTSGSKVLVYTEF